MRILQVNKLYYPYTGGIEYVVRQIAKGLCQKTDMKVLVCQEKKETCIEELDGVTVIRAGSWKMVGNLPLSWKFIQEFPRQAKDRDILIFHLPFPIGDLAYFLSGIRDKKVIVWWHSDIVRQKNWMFLYRPLMEWLLKKSDCILVATKGHIQGSQYLKPYRKKCRVIPFGVRQEIEEDSFRYYYQERNLFDQERKQFDQETEKQKEMKQKTENKKQEEKVRFLFVGRLVYYKGCDLLLRAWKGLEQAELVIVGSGNLEQEMKQYIEQEALADQICLKGNLSDQEVMKEYRRCDVFVLPSLARSEAFGLVQIEAMAYGKPVINTWLPSGVPYVSLDQKTGLTVEAGNEKALHQAMAWMIAHPKERKEMGIRARKRVEQKYLTATMIERLEKLCKEIGKEKRE